jgi:putative ABC transport system substrate-binding protein
MKKNLILVLSLVMLLYLFLQFPKQHKKTSIGVIVPVEHRALQEIVEGLTETLKKEMTQPYQLKVLNAQGDLTLQKSMILQLAKECDVIAAIGTATSQMATHLASSCRILSLASSYPDGRSVTISDEISPELSIRFFKRAFPGIQKMTLLYSSLEKVALDVPTVVEAAKRYGIEVERIMVHHLSELYSIKDTISRDSQAIFILKDHLIVSGIQTVLKLAQHRKMIVMTSDEGSVKEGACFAIGVKEKDIGQKGAQKIRTILEGSLGYHPAFETMESNVRFFIHPTACIESKIDIDALRKRALEEGLKIEDVTAVRQENL